MAVSKKSVVTTAGSLFSGLMLFAIAQPAQAFTFYTGVQTVFLPSAPPPSGAALTARNGFVTAATPLGTVGTENFETPAANNSFYSATGNGSLNFAGSGITVQVTNGQIGGTNNGISNTDGSILTGAIGYNTTSGGSRLLRIAQQTGIDPAQTSVTFTFDTPLRAFGLYITDYGDSDSAAALNASINSTSVTGFPRLIPQSAGNFFTGRSVQFFGFTAASADPSINSITFQFSGLTTAIDRLAMDDIRFVKVPVPPQFVGTALAAMLAAFKVRRSRCKSKQTDAPVNENLTNLEALPE